MRNKVVAWCLIVTMLFLLVPVEAMAAIQQMAGNSEETNQRILSELSAFDEGSEEEAYDLLERLGLLDEEGQLVLDQPILLDDQRLTLEETLAFLEDPQTDLSRIAQVDGVPVALGDLRTMIRIEQELARIRDTYLSGEPFSDGQRVQLEDLMTQLQSEGIQMKGEGQQASPLKLVITPDPNNPEEIVYDSNTPIELKYNLSLTGDMPVNGTVGFAWRRVTGAIPNEYYTASLVLKSSVYNQWKYPGEGTNFVFGYADPGFVIQQANQFSGVLTVKLGYASKNLLKMIGCNISGVLEGFLEFYGANGLVLSTNGSDVEQAVFPIVVKKPAPFEGGYSWLTSMTGETNYEKNMTDYTDMGYNEYTNPRWVLVDLLNQDKLAEYGRMEATAGEIFPDGKVRTKVDARIFLHDSGLFNKFLYRMESALPVGYDGGSPVQALSLLEYLWNNKKVESVGGVLKTTGGEAPYINIIGGPMPAGQPEAQAVSIIMESVNGRLPLTLNTVWPNAPVFTGRDSTGAGPSISISFSGVGKQVTQSATLTLHDKTNPSLKSITVKPGTYTSGDYVPIELEFSEAVDTSALTMMINGYAVTAGSLELNTVGRKAVALYQVKDVDATTISIASVSNLNDLSGNKTNLQNNGGLGWNFDDVTLKSTQIRNAITELTVSPSTVLPTELSKGVTMTLSLKQALAFTTKYTDYQSNKGKAPFAIRLTRMSDKTTTLLDMQMAETAGVLSAVATCAPLPLTATDQTYQVEVVAYENVDDTTGTIVFGRQGSFTVQAVQFVDGLQILYPEGDTQQLSLTDTYRPKLQVGFTGQPTSKTGKWASSQPTIATIDTTGQVTLTGNGVGTVSFSFTADDGGLADPNGNHVKTATSKTYTVICGNSPALVVPQEANRIMARQNATAQVRWSSNASFFTTADFQYTVDLFSGSLTLGQLAGKTPVWTGTADKTAQILQLPPGQLSLLSVLQEPAYTVRISMPHPALSSERLEAVCHIVVVPNAAVATLARPIGGLYRVDNESIDLAWTIENYVEGHTAGTLQVTRTQTVNGKDETATIWSEAISTAAGVYALSPEPVTGLKDTYLVTLRASNGTDQADSTDAFPLYVYNRNAIQLQVDGQPVNALTLDNDEKVSGALPTDSGDILAMRETLALLEIIGLYGVDQTWSQLKDGIHWQTSNNGTVSVNYRQGGLYEDLSRFDMDTFLPQTRMALAGLNDGTATVTATHANTGLQAAVAVDVHTLREKFYLFSLAPMQTTTLIYTDGQGTSKTVDTNNEGLLALYEPNGIASDVQLRATDPDGAVWLGTLYQSQIQSGERDATRMQLYPLNTFKLRQAARVELFIKKPDGTPFTGTATLRGGVYKNSGYCQEARMLVNQAPDFTHLLLDGKTPQTASVGEDGKLTVFLDSTQFWSVEKGETLTAGSTLSPTDNLQYIFELTDLAGFAPLLVHANGNITLEELMYSAGSILTLDPYTGAPAPVLSRQTVDYGLSGVRLIDVRHSQGRIGPNEAYPQVKLQTTVLLWGQPVTTTGFTLRIGDEYGFMPQVQQSRTISYPFSSLPVVENTMTLSKTTITDSGWIPAGKDRGLRLRLFRDDAQWMDMPVSPRLVDLTQVPKLTDSENVKGILVDMRSGSGTAGATMSGGDAILNNLMGVLGSLSGPVDGTNFKMLITPGEDNAVFKAFIWAGYDSLGLDKVDYTESGLFLDTKLAESSLSVAPSLNDLTNMAKGAYDPKKTASEAMDKQAAGKGNGSKDFSGQLEGYFEAQIRYNFDQTKWEIYVLGGGFTAGFGASYTYTVNGQAGPVPLTATFSVGGSIQLDFKAAIRYSPAAGLAWADSITTDTVNDYLTTLRINAYVNAFGGLGFDYTVIALKIGLFGKLSVDSQNKFLSRTYLADTTQRQINGQGLQVSGEIGIKFVAQFLFISYEFVLASVQAGAQFTFNEWKTITEYWNNTGSGLGRMALSAGVAGRLVPVSATATLQSRAYLDDYARSWGRSSQIIPMRSIDDKNGLELLQSNAYPGTKPLVSDDGALLVYASDSGSVRVEDTRIHATQLMGGQYPQGSPLPAPSGFNGFGDSGLSLAGEKPFAVTAWVRQSASLPDKAAGEAISPAEQALLLNGTDIVVALHNNNVWNTWRLTANSTPDLSPVVATNGQEAVVVWRSVYAADEKNLLDFSVQDYLMYSRFRDGVWSKPQQIYNGTSGAVKGVTAAILADGTAAVAYVLDPDRINGNAVDQEIGYTVLGADDILRSTVLLTHDSWLDENPQMTTASFPDGRERFVVAWHSVREGVGDLRLSAFDGQGILSNQFLESILQATQNAPVQVQGNFRLAGRRTTDKDIGNLSLIWAQPERDEAGETDHSTLQAVTFVQDGAQLRISAPLEVGRLPTRTLMDHFDVYLDSAASHRLKAVIQATETKDIDLSDPTTYTEYTMADGTPVQVANEEVKLYTATAEYQNGVRLDKQLVDYATLAPNSLVPIRFAITNAGYAALDSVTIKMGGKETNFEGLALQPNESRTLTCWHPLGDSIENLAYSLTALFGSDTRSLEGTVYLDYPDVGISQLGTTDTDRGMRTLHMTLYNSAAASLAGGKSRRLRLAFSTDPEGNTPVQVQTSSPGVTVETDHSLTLSDEALLQQVDAGACSLELQYDLAAEVARLGLTEIPEAGIRLYARIWAEEADTVTAKTATLPEYNCHDNEQSVLFESLLVRSGLPVSLSVTQSLSSRGNTVADVIIFNHSLQPRPCYGIFLSLLDEKGQVLERIEYRNTDASSPFVLTGEERRTKTFSFKQSGSQVVALFGDTILDMDNTSLSAISFEGLPLHLSDYVNDGTGQWVANAPDTQITSTLATFLVTNPGSTVRVNGQRAEGSLRVTLLRGDNTIALDVTSQDGQHNTKYVLHVRQVTPLPPVPVPDPSPISNTTTAETTQELQPDGIPESAVNPHPFLDVLPGDWFHDAVQQGHERGLLYGVGPNTFAPNRNATRASWLMLLYRVEGSPVPTKTNPFPDVAAQSWYAAAVSWAWEAGIVHGYPDGTFQPDKPITRQEAAVVLYQYALKIGRALPGENGRLDYPDEEGIDLWAREAAFYCQRRRIIQGDAGGRFLPDSYLRRSEMSELLIRYMDEK